MKTKLIIIFITALAFYSSSAFAAIIHVPGDQPTIQDGIDATNDGDTVVVMKGRYTGPGNRNLNFHGKRITVRSQDPENNECIRATIIDAEGQGVIVRFVSDEGPECVFEGFTLIAGDTSKPVRGLPGFFEFSLKARSTTRRLRVETNYSQILPEQELRVAIGIAADLYGFRVWDGNNPFDQPAITTDYYGSGDVDADGSLTMADVSLSQEMADGLKTPSARADVNGDKVVNSLDVSAIGNSLVGGILPAWWNSLTDRTERKTWVTKFMEIDQTDKFPYAVWEGFGSEWVCSDFARQTYIHGTFYLGDLFSTDYDGGQTVFNLPVYECGVTAYGGGHAINAILIGDDPLNFDDWLFLEPQTDQEVRPGMWNMVYNSSVIVMAPYVPRVEGGHKITFFVDETGWDLQEYSPDLILTRPLPSQDSPDNHSDIWNPRILPEGDKILFDRSRDDVSRATDIHLAEWGLVDTARGKPLIMSPQCSRLLDVTKAPDGTIHLLWKGRPDNGHPGVFHGKFNPNALSVTNVTRVCSQAYRVTMGRILVTPGGEVHAFWFRFAGYWSSNKGSPVGIYWSRWTGSGWQSPQRLTTEVPENYSFPWYPYTDRRDICRYLFGVETVGENNGLLLVWQMCSSWSCSFYERYYDGEWGPSNRVVENPPSMMSSGIDLRKDSKGILHLVYWLGLTEERRGNLMHRTHDGVSWSIPEVVDNSGRACCPRMATSAEDGLLLVWEREISGQVVPIISRYAGGTWDAPQTLNVRPEADAWYPTLNVLPDGMLAIAWSSRSPDIVTIETYEYFPAPWAGFSGGPISGEAPLTVSFSDESIGKVDTWEWQFGDGTGSVDINPNHAYQDPGHYTVSLTVSSPGGSDTETKTDYITVTYPAPVANFTANPISGVHPLTVNFTDQSTGNITSWSWDFDDGSTSDDQNPTHTYNDPGAYTVNLTVNGPGGTDTKTKTDYIVVDYLTPIANFTADPTNGVAPLTVSFTDESTGDITSYLWDFGDNETSTEENPAHTFDNAGIYTVSLSVSGPDGSDSETKSGYITVSEPGNGNGDGDGGGGDGGGGGGGGGCFICSTTCE